MKQSTTISVKLAAPESEFSSYFVQGMANRMAVSFHKYGPIDLGYPHSIDAIASMKQRVQAYLDTGNTEYLIDAANFMMIEFMLPSVDGAVFTPTDSNGSTGRVTIAGRVSFLGNSTVLG